MPNIAIRYDRPRIKRRKTRLKPRIIRKYWQPGVILKICCRDGDDDRPLSFRHRDQDKLLLPDTDGDDIKDDDDETEDVLDRINDQALAS